jgi:hypothetical protein
VQMSERKIERRSKPMAFTAPGRAIPRNSTARRATAKPHVGKKSIHHRAAKKKQKSVGLQCS